MKKERFELHQIDTETKERWSINIDYLCGVNTNLVNILHSGDFRISEHKGICKLTSFLKKPFPHTEDIEFESSEIINLVKILLHMQLELNLNKQKIKQ